MKKGFTLIEILVSISITIIVFSIIFIGLRYSINIYNLAIEKSRNLKTIMQVYDILSSQINSVFESKEIDYNIYYKNNEFYITTTNGIDYNGISIIHYLFKDKKLLYKEIPYTDLTLFDNIKDYKILSKLDLFLLEFIKDKREYKIWDFKDLPDFVKIKLGYNNENFESIIDIGLNMKL